MRVNSFASSQNSSNLPIGIVEYGCRKSNGRSRTGYETVPLRVGTDEGGPDGEPLLSGYQQMSAPGAKAKINS